jgi:hypothetical protein
MMKLSRGCLLLAIVNLAIISLASTATSTDLINHDGRVVIGTTATTNYQLYVYGSTTYVPLHLFRPAAAAGTEVQLSTFSAP